MLEQRLQHQQDVPLLSYVDVTTRKPADPILLNKLCVFARRDWITSRSLRQGGFEAIEPGIRGERQGVKTFAGAGGGLQRQPLMVSN
jgi:hypothetical protein